MEIDVTKEFAENTPTTNPDSSKNIGKLYEEQKKTSAEENMEATIVTDDVIIAGGFGATDDIGSVLPVAVDATDFEASLLNARNYEEPQEEICRHGLGWQETTEIKEDI